MMDKNAILKLCAELEAADKGSRELDARIALAIKWCPPQHDWFTKNFNKHEASKSGRIYAIHEPPHMNTGRRGPHIASPKVSTDLNAAYGLIPSGFKPYQITYHPVSASDNWLYYFDFTQRAKLSALAKTHALAVCAASLRAVAAEIDAKK